MFCLLPKSVTRIALVPFKRGAFFEGLLRLNFTIARDNVDRNFVKMTRSNINVNSP